MEAVGERGIAGRRGPRRFFFMGTCLEKKEGKKTFVPCRRIKLSSIFCSLGCEFDHSVACLNGLLSVLLQISWCHSALCAGHFSWPFSSL